ncbi:hypothetical protein [Streptomyces rubiginosohelvolus]|uniref:hypothetical protein n=1 Tax=Streptomyces rubiginosohelvolus TaxID=67362 RepID=UPI00364EA412
MSGDPERGDPAPAPAGGADEGDDEKRNGQREQEDGSGHILTRLFLLMFAAGKRLGSGSCAPFP